MASVPRDAVGVNVTFGALRLFCYTLLTEKFRQS